MSAILSNDHNTLGSEIDAFQKLKREKSSLEKEISVLEQSIAQAEKNLLERMDAEGVSKASGRTATISVSESIVPSVVDWDGFYRFIHRNNYYHLLERRPSVGGCRELFETKGRIPGVEPFTKRKLRTTAL